MLADFISCVAEGREPVLDVDFGINMSLPGILAHESAVRGGMPIEIPQFLQKVNKKNTVAAVFFLFGHPFGSAAFGKSLAKAGVL